MLWPFRSRNAGRGSARHEDVGAAGAQPAGAPSADTPSAGAQSVGAGRPDAGSAVGRAVAVGGAPGAEGGAARPLGQWRELPVLTGVMAVRPASGGGWFTRTLPGRRLASDLGEGESSRTGW
jgi:hypothetical protein